MIVEGDVAEVSALALASGLYVRRSCSQFGGRQCRWLELVVTWRVDAVEEAEEAGVVMASVREVVNPVFWVSHVAVKGSAQCVITLGSLGLVCTAPIFGGAFSAPHSGFGMSSVSFWESLRR